MPNSNTSDFDGSLSNEPKRIEGIVDGNDDGDNSMNRPAAANAPRALPAIQLYTIVAAVSLAGFLYSLDVTIITTAIPAITTHFHTIKDIGWYGSAYLITLCSCAPVMGKIYQYYYSKVVFFIFVVIFEIGSLICGVAPSSTAFIVGRAIAGIGGAGLFNGGLAIVAASSTKEQRPSLVSLVYAFSLLGMVIGPIIGGVFTERVSWRWCFYINLPVGGITLGAITLVRIPDTRDKSKTAATLYEAINRLDPIGFCLFAPTCIMLLLALQWGGSTYAWSSSTIIGLFVGFGALLTVFCVWESRRGDSAMIPGSILRQKIVYSSCLINGLQFASLWIFAYYLPVWFQVVKGASPIISGAYYMATAGPLIAATMLTGFIAKKGNTSLYSLIGNSIAAIGSGLMALFTPFSPTGAWVGYQVLSGVGRGITQQQPVLAVQQNLEPSKIPIGVAMVLFGQFFGGGLFLALAETDLSSSLRSTLPEYAPDVNATLIFDAGATGVRAVVSIDQLPGVILSYNKAIINTFYLGTAASAFAAIVSLYIFFEHFRVTKPSK
ncbi:putative efflux pump antibiotic resistance protein [Talaromyces proteolyticus]|uniref:Efflux pump antibiotic resistance protein n=1 Tax=Talaromyces proteolyticus TaxID=1131652 RepID=A0AAD4KNL0_9EURO|nr:putative efflux pump antibiotic resistance protein [Talaromyces proteolyticus]KAH8692060.1 putative efflux pump antibiotic resistance protein [Talaromyces proteolyticus]